MLSVIIPTCNEAENVPILTQQLAHSLKDIDHELIFVDDSTDGTPQVLEKLVKRDTKIRCLHREKERGLGSAVVQGFKLAKGDILAVMDADLQHPPQLLPAMLKALETGADIVIPSRFIPGASDGGLMPHRKLVSWAARMIGKVALKRLRGISDTTGGFFMLRRQVIDRVYLNPIGWKILIEILVKGNYTKIAEMPYSFKPRAQNKSKMSLREQANYFKHLVQLVRMSPEDRRFWKQVSRELLGFFVGSAVFYLSARVVPGDLAALLGALAYVPANRMVMPPRRGKKYAYAPVSKHSMGSRVAKLAGGIGSILALFSLGIHLLNLNYLASYIMGAGIRTATEILVLSWGGFSLGRIRKRVRN